MQILTPLGLLCSILVANNGIGAVKFIRSVRSWAYKTFGSERAVSLVAMATPEVLRPRDRLSCRAMPCTCRPQLCALGSLALAYARMRA